MSFLEQNDFKRKLDKLIESNKYKESYEITINYLESLQEKEVENILRYFELLVNKNGNKNKKTEYIEPLIKYINNNYAELIEYTICCRELNRAFLEISRTMEKLFNNLKEYCFPQVYIIVISKIEKGLHEISNSSIDFKEKYDIEDINKQRNILSYHQMTVESLSKLLKKMILEKDDFNDSLRNIESRNEFTSYIRKVNKKINSSSKLISLINEISYTYSLSHDIQFNNLRVDRSTKNEVEFIYKSEKEYLRSKIPEIRMGIFDYNELIKYIDRNEIKEEDFLTKELDSIVEIVDDNFIVKIDLISEEFLSHIRVVGIDFFHSIEQMLGNNFIDFDKFKSKIKKEEKESIYTFQEATRYYFCILLLANIYYMSVEHYKRRVGKSPLITISIFTELELNEIINQIVKMIFGEEIDDFKLSQLKELFTFGDSKIYDLYYKPLICFDNKITIMPSVLQKNNFARTFINHMNDIDTSLREGSIYEKYLLSIFKEHGFKVYDIEKPLLNFRLDYGNKGDIDILVLKDNFLFYGQAKNRSQPLDSKDYINLSRKIKKAATQLKYAKEYLMSNPEHILNHFKVDSLERFKLVPFIISNSFYKSGEKQNGISIIDTSSFNKIFNDGSINMYKGKEVIYKKILRKSKHVTGEEFYNYIQKPYFLDTKLYSSIHFPYGHNIGKRLYITGLDNETIKYYHKNTYISKAKHI